MATHPDPSDAELTRAGGPTLPSDPTPTPPLEAGVLYAERYRIVDLLGAGGMGQVYRAHDTKLDVAVALKRVNRLSSVTDAQIAQEVRLARQVTHRAICRVFDVGDAQGEPYITMEFVDGEDLGSLLRRIGRLPSIKVIDVARQACAGLAAAHAHGILHRDLKPANILMDRRGDVRITDFGIAAVQGAVSDGRLFGTPAYMAPEQIQNAGASAQSDLYALALVLYELVTGQHAFPDRPNGFIVADDALTPPSTLVADIDPGFEQLLLQTLDPNPASRPASALAFAAALPGGDVLQAALEAGQTPSPALVASAGTSGVLSRRVDLALLAAALVGVAVITATAYTRAIDQVPLPDPPAVLAARARTILTTVTGEPTSRYTMFTLQGDTRYLTHLVNHRDAAIDPPRLAQLVYREGDQRIVPGLIEEGPPFALSLANPAMVEAGAKAVVLDAIGRLRQLRVNPRDGTTSDTPPFDWTMLHREAGIDPTSLEDDTPAGPPPPYADRRFAWRARQQTGGDVQIDAASLGNRPTWFEVRPRADGVEATAPNRIWNLISALIACSVLAIALVMAKRNMRLGRADVIGAQSLAGFLFVGQLVAWVLGLTFVPIEIELPRVLVVAALLFVYSLFVASLYIAFEPIVRRRWPTSLISWSRLLAGRFTDARIGRDVLIGATASIVGTALYQLLVALLPASTMHGDRAATLGVGAFMGTRHLLSAILFSFTEATANAMIVVLFYSLLVMLVRRTWIATLLILAALLTPLFLSGQISAVELVVIAIAIGLFVGVFVQFGLVALMAYMVNEAIFSNLPLAFAGGWRNEFAVVTLLTGVALLAFAAYTAAGDWRRPIRL